MYLRTNEETEVANALRFAARLSSELQADPTYWRWIIVAVHNAAQGMMVLSLRHGNGFLTLTDECFKETLQAHKCNQTPPPQRLDTYLNLYKKVKSPNTGQIGSNKRFCPKATQGISIRRLNALRNDFSHFTPMHWSLELDGLPQICRDVLALISFLGWQTQNVHWHAEESPEVCQAATAELQLAMNRLDQHYAKQRVKAC